MNRSPISASDVTASNQETYTEGRQTFGRWPVIELFKIMQVFIILQGKQSPDPFPSVSSLELSQVFSTARVALLCMYLW